MNGWLGSRSIEDNSMAIDATRSIRQLNFTMDNSDKWVHHQTDGLWIRI